MITSTGLTFAGLKSEFFQRFRELNQRVYFTDLATRIPSNKSKETYAFLGTVPPLRAWGTGRLSRGLHAESYDVENEKYESTLQVDRDEIDDDQTGQIRIRVQELADRAATHKDFLIGELLKNGADVGFNSYDGVTFFNDAHVSGKSGNQDNTLGAAATAPTDPTTVEFRKALGQAIARMMGFKDDQGEPMSLNSEGLVCVVPPTMLVSALEAVNSTLLSSTTNVMQGAAKVIAMPHLTTASKWYLLKTNQAVRPFVFQDRMPVEFVALEHNSETGFMNEVFHYGVRARYAMTYGYWQYAVEVTFA